MNGIPAPDEAAHLDGLLMHELSVVNPLIARYVLRHLDSDAGLAAPISVADEMVLANRVAAAAEAIRARARRRGQQAGKRA